MVIAIIMCNRPRLNIEITLNRFNSVITRSTTPSLPSINPSTLMIALTILFKIQRASCRMSSQRNRLTSQANRGLITDIQTPSGPSEIGINVGGVAFTIAAAIQIEIALAVVALFEGVVRGVGGGSCEGAVDGRGQEED